MSRAGSTAAAGAALLLFAFLALWPVVSGARSFFHLDLRYEHVPIWDATQKALLAGESPFWVDGQYCGNPLLFTQEAPLFYPLTAPLLATGAPANRLADLFTLFHFWLAGFLAFLLLRDLDCGVEAAIFGGVAWMLSARMVQSAIWPNAVVVMALLPALLLGMLRLARGRRRSGVLWTALSTGLALLAARPHVLVGAAPLFAVVLAAAFFASRRKIALLADLALAAILAAAIAAPSLLPSAALYPETSRAGGLSRSERDLNPLASSGDLDQVFLPTDGPRRWPEAAAYPGALVAVLFVAGLVLAFTRREPRFRALLLALAAGGGLGLLFAFGQEGPLGFVADLPLLSGFRIPARYLISWSLALAVGAALALSRAAGGSARGRTLAALCVVVLAVDLALHARRAAPTGPSAVYAVEPAVLDVARALLAPDPSGYPRRLWSAVEQPMLWFYEDEAEQLAVARMFEPLYGAIGLRYGVEVVGGAGPSLLRWKNTFRSVNARAAQLAGVGAFVLPAPGSPASPGSPRPMVVQRYAGLPRAIVVPEAIIAEGRDAAIARVLDPQLDPRRTAVLEAGEPLSASPGLDWRNASARLLSRGPGRATLETIAPGRGVLVVFNTYERGWRAAVDGAPAPVVPADGAFQGVRLPPGRHVVELRYRPPRLTAGLVAAAVGLVGLALAARRLPEENRTDARPTVEKE